MDWKYRSDDYQTVSLHDCILNKLCSDEDGLSLIFEDGIDICAENPLNETGRHKRTGNAAVALKNGRFLRGTLYISDAVGNKEEKPLREEEIAAVEPEIKDFTRYPDSVFLACEAWLAPREYCFCTIEFACTGVEFCWNEFTDDAWFQD